MTQAIARLALNIIYLLQILMLITAVSSWIPQVRESKIGYWLHTLTEPIVSPFRRLLSRIPAMNRFPLDLSFMLAYLVLILLYQLLAQFL